MLRDEIRAGSRDAIFVRLAIYRRIIPVEILQGRRRWSGPLESGALPGIRGGEHAVLQAPKEIPEKNELRRGREESGEGDEFVQRKKRSEIVHPGGIGVAANPAFDSDEM